MKPKPLRLLAVLSAAILASAAPADAEIYAASDLAGQKSDAEAGFAGFWRTAPSMRLDKKRAALVGTGWARREMLRPIDFAADSETFFRYTVTRNNTARSGTSDYASLALFNDDKAIKQRPMHFGISSNDIFDFGLVEHKSFGRLVKDGEPQTLIVRLVTKADGPDQLEGWAFPADKVPAERPEPMVTDEREYDAKASSLHFNTGNLDGLEAVFEDVRVGSDWASVTAAEVEAPAGQPDKAEPRQAGGDDAEAAAGEAGELGGFRPMRHVRVADNGTHALPIFWSTVSLLPGPRGAAPTVLLQGDQAWLESNTFVYRPDESRRSTAEPKPDARLPLYGPPTFETPLPRGNYQAVPNGQGYDLIDLGSLKQVATADADGKLTMLASPRDTLAGLDDAAAARRDMGGRAGAFKTIADADGDGVPDVLLAQMVDPGEIASYWPRREPPWTTQDRANVGPDADLTTSDGFRGYDVAGNWLGTRRTSELTWMRGEQTPAGLVFGERRPVYHGRDDVAVQWRTWSNRMSAAVVRAKDERGAERPYVVLFSGYERPLMLPVLDDLETGTLRLGAAAPLLRDDQPITDLHLTQVRDVLDVNGDGTHDILCGTGSNGRLMVLSGDRVGGFEVVGPLQTVGGVLAGDTLTVPAVGDWDGDGLSDLVTGDGTGYYLLWPGTRDPTVFGGSRTFTDTGGRPIMVKGETNLQGPHESGWSYSQPEIFDWDADGKPDLLGNDNTATLRLYQRSGGETTLKGAVFTHDGAKLPVGWRSRMTALPGKHHIAGDDRPVLLYVGPDSVLALGIPAKTGSTEIAEVRPLAFEDGEPVVVSGRSGMSGRTQLSTPDWDGDGVWDVMYNTPAVSVVWSERDPAMLASIDALKTSVIYWLRNVGTNDKPVFAAPRRVTWKDGGVIRVEKHSLNVEPADLNGDGKLDLLVGDGPGFVFGLMRDELSW